MKEMLGKGGSHGKLVNYLSVSLLDEVINSGADHLCDSMSLLSRLQN